MLKILGKFGRRSKQMVGWHYTTAKDWESIRVQGLVPYLVDYQPGLNPFFPTGVVGIWVWKRCMEGESEAGTVIDQAARKGTTKVVKLKVRFSGWKRLRYGLGPEERLVTILHLGSIEKWTYHVDEPAFIVVEAIPLKDIELVRIFDVTKFQ